MGAYHQLLVDPPKAALREYNVVMKDLGIATGCTHLFAVHRFAPCGAYGDPGMRQLRSNFLYRRRIYLYPTHAVIWAAHCARLPPMPPTEFLPLTCMKKADKEQEAVFCVRMPMRSIPLPFPQKFFTLTLFVYTLSKVVFVSHLLPCAAFKAFLPETVVRGDEAYTKNIEALAAACNSPSDVCRYARNVWGTYLNMCALGMGDPRIWDALNFAWTMVWDMMEIVEAREQQRQSSISSA